jgi:sugar phosphate isomerase/epimerase
MKIGAQFYTVREYCKDLDSFAETLKKVADIGYEYVQISGTCAFEAEWLKTELDKNGLKCVLTHTAPDKIVGDTAAVIADHDVFGCRCVGLGWNAFNADKAAEELDAFVEKFGPAAKALRDGGKYFMYHNHNQEFIKLDGKIILQHLAERFAPDELGFTVDTYWVQRGGADPARLIEEMKGRTPVIHLKDHTFDAKMAVVGEGNINFDRVFAMAEKGGTEFMLVEQDDCGGEDPFDCLRRSYEFLRSRGFE